MATERTRYSDEDRASALVLLEVSGYPAVKGGLLRTAANLGIPQSTLRGWWNESRNPVPALLREEKKAELADLLRTEIDGALRAMAIKRNDANYRDLGTVTGILIDKLQLITGKPTDRTEITDAADARERIHSRITGIAERKRAGSDTEGLDN